MRDRWGLNERAFAKWYPKVVGLSEDAGQRETRAELIGRARGRTLELGAGNGYNLPHYRAIVTELVVTEPSPHMLDLLRAALDNDPPPVGSWELVQTGAEELPFDDDSFDTVTAAFVHCTIPQPQRALSEIARVLRPGGQYLFLEHVRSPDNRVLAAFQDAIAIPHTYVAAGCHPNRRFEAMLADSPLTLQHLTNGHMPRAFPSVRPTVRGVAVAP